ncbi:hypothetical protein FRC08_002562 [Ceratobasidium sp. 394]|nr:hypothetical protein FRC08_002562 [Ceratobasidium sp. 394]
MLLPQFRADSQHVFALFPSTTALLNILGKLEVQHEDSASSQPSARRSNLRTASSPSNIRKIYELLTSAIHHPPWLLPQLPAARVPQMPRSHPVLGRTAFNRSGYCECTHVYSVRLSSHTCLPCIYVFPSPHYIELRASTQSYKPKQPSSCQDSPQPTMTGFIAALDSHLRPATADGCA